MPIQSVILFLISILMSAILLGLSFRLKTKHPTQYLDIYFYYMMAVVSYGFVNWIGPTFVVYWTSIAPNSNDSTQSTNAIILFTACAVPLALIKLHLFLVFLLKLLNQSLTLLISRALYSISAVLTLMTFYLIAHDFGAQELVYSGGFIILLGIAVLITTFICLFYFLSKIEQLENKALQNAARNFGWIYLIGYVVYASPFYLNYLVEQTWYVAVSPYIYYLMHLVPIFFLQRLSGQYKNENSADMTNPVNFELITNQCGISSREATVLSLILKGKNNNDIAEQLSISPNTVRNHIYNIYSKTNVKNRIQLQRLCDGNSPENDSEI